MSDGIPVKRIQTRCGLCGLLWETGHTCIWPISVPTTADLPGLTPIEEDLTRRIEVLERIVAQVVLLLTSEPTAAPVGI